MSREHTVGLPGLSQIVLDLYPICRSITGDGLRATLQYINSHLDISVAEVPTGTPAFDWTIPDEWNIKDAFIKNMAGERVVDFNTLNLHVVNYSEPVKGKYTLDELRPHLHTIPEMPDAVPYVTSYYNRSWGFCVSKNVLDSLNDEQYDVEIDSSLEPGALSYGELVIPGEQKEEILFSCHSCHPSLANDNLSGIAVAMHLAKMLAMQKNRYTYRFLFVPGTIGAVTWLSRNEDILSNIVGGLTLANLGDPGHFNYKRSRKHNTMIDSIVEYALKSSEHRYGIRDFSPYGYDERQYCSPGINLPVGSFSRSVHGTFKEYHTSLDSPDFLSEESLRQSLSLLSQIVLVAENDRRFVNLSPNGEPQLGKRGLYSQSGGYGNNPDYSMALLWVLNYSDGGSSLLDIANRSGIDFGTLVGAAERLEQAGLIQVTDGNSVE